jgi:hypothetical protein
MAPKDVDGRVKPGHDGPFLPVTFLLTMVTVYVTQRIISLFEGASPVTAD